MSSFLRPTMWARMVLTIALALLAATDSSTQVRGSAVGVQLRKLDGSLRADVDRRSTGQRRVIVTVSPGEQAAFRRLLAARGESVLAEHPSLGALTAVVPADDLEWLAQQSSVLSVSTDAVVRPHGLLGGLLSSVTGTVGRLVTGTLTGVLNTVGTIIDPSLDQGGEPVPPAVLRATLGLDDSWSGRGVGVAVIDSGLEMSAEFNGRLTAFYDFTNGKADAGSAFDDYGHGTHVAGTIGGSGALSNRREYRGLAPDVAFVVLKVLDANGAGYTSDVIRAIDFAVANRARFGIDIINLSLGHPIYEPASTDPLVQAVERASRAGIVVIAAAGNLGTNPTTGLTGYAGITSPGNAPSAITVGALMTSDTVGRADDRIPDYSSAGPTWYDALVKPDLLAPGHRIIAAAAKHSTIYRDYPQLRAPDPDYIRLSGTSMATAVTSGVVARVLQANRAAHQSNPRLAPNAVKGVLQYTAVAVRNDLGLEYDLLRAGAGGLNGGGAEQLGRAIDTSTQPGGFWLNPQPQPWTTIGGEPLAWQQTVIWGSAVIWGSTMPVNQMAWGNAVIWGSTTTWGNAVIWGSNVVWTDPQSWGNAVIWGSTSLGTTDGNAVIWGSTGGMTAQNTAWKSLDDGGGTGAANAR